MKKPENKQKKKVETLTKEGYLSILRKASKKLSKKPHVLSRDTSLKISSN